MGRGGLEKFIKYVHTHFAPPVQNRWASTWISSTQLYKVLQYPPPYIMRAPLEGGCVLPHFLIKHHEKILFLTVRVHSGVVKHIQGKMVCTHPHLHVNSSIYLGPSPSFFHSFAYNIVTIHEDIACMPGCNKMHLIIYMMIDNQCVVIYFKDVTIDCLIHQL